MPRFFQKNYYTNISDIDKVDLLHDYIFYPDIHLPIQAGNSGINAIKSDGNSIVATYGPLGAQYVMDQWDNLNSALLLDSNGYQYFLPIAPSDISSSIGTFCFWYRPNFNYGDIAEDKYLISGNNFLEFYYSKDTHTFTGRIFSGTGFNTICVSGTFQKLVMGEWIHVGIGYNCNQGLFIYVSGTLNGVNNVTWETTSVPSFISIGSISGTSISNADGYIDDIRYYCTKLPSSEMLSIKNITC